MVLVLISASLWGCLGCDKFFSGNIYTEEKPLIVQTQISMNSSQCQLLLCFVLSTADGAARVGHHVAIGCIKKTHWSLIEHSSTSHGMHNLRMMAARSSSTNSAIV